MTTISQLTERVRRILVGGDPSILDRVQDPEIKSAIASAAGSMLKAVSLSVHYTAEGGSIMDSALIATYENIAVQRGNNGHSRAMLPAQPIAGLPERTGVFSVYPSGLPEDEFIPLPPGMFGHLRKGGVYNGINAITYTQEARYVDVHSDLIGAGITTVDMKLVVVDPAALGDYDPLPIGPDMELDVIKEVVRLYGGVWPEDSKNDK